jgi:translation initiation factor IF-1
MDKIVKNVAARFQDKTSGFQLEAMSNLPPKDTGVDGAVIWISAGEFYGMDAQHGPRIKVVLGNKITTEGLRDSVSVRITDPPVVLGKLPGKIRKQVIQFVEKNRDVLLRHWNGELGSKETLNLLEPV